MGLITSYCFVKRGVIRPISPCISRNNLIIVAIINYHGYYDLVLPIPNIYVGNMYDSCMFHVCFMYDMAQTYISKLTDYKILIKNDVCYGGFLFFMVTKIIDICHKNKPLTTKK